MNRIVCLSSFAIAIAIFNVAIAEETTPKKQRLHVVVDADGNVEITPSKTEVRKSEKKVVVTCDRVRIAPPKKGNDSISMTFVGDVRMVYGRSRAQSKRMTLSSPSGVRLLLNFGGIPRPGVNK